MFTIDRITLRRDPIYHSTYTGKPPDEPAVLALALNELFVPLLQRQFPEITDFYLPPEGCSYRMALVQIKKAYPGHARRVMMGVWSHLRQFMYTKFIVVVDEDVDIRDWREVIWAITTRVDPVRDTMMVENTPIDYLDFASPVSGLVRPGPETLVHRVGEAAGVVPQPVEQAGDRVVVRVDRIAGQQVAVLGVQHEDQPHQHRQQARIDVVGIVGQHVPQQLAVRDIVGRLEAAHQFVQGRQHLLGQLGGDGVLVLAAVWPGSPAVAGSRPARTCRSAHSSMCRAANIGRPATWTISCDVEGRVAAALAARGVDQPQLPAVGEQTDGHLRSRAAAARTWPAGRRASAGADRPRPAHRDRHPGEQLPG